MDYSSDFQRKGDGNMLGIVIINYNTYEMTIRCIDSVMQTCPIPFHIYVVDNCSKNDSFHLLKEKYENRHAVTVLQTPENGGYSYGLNFGFKAAGKDGCEVMLASNNDLQYLAGSIEKMHSLLISDDKIAVVGCRPIVESKREETWIYDNMTFFTRLIRTSMYKVFLRPVKYDFTEATPVFTVDGSCFMIRLRVLKAIGWLDEHVFLFEEERILSFEIQDLGLLVYLEPHVRVRHYQSNTVGHRSAFSYIEFIKSDYYVCNKFYHFRHMEYWIWYFVRVSNYLAKCLFDKDYRLNIGKYFDTLKELRPGQPAVNG